MYPHLGKTVEWCPSCEVSNVYQLRTVHVWRDVLRSLEFIPQFRALPTSKQLQVSQGLTHSSFENPPGRRMNSRSGHLFQCLSTLIMKSFFLVPNWNFPCCNIYLFPLLLSLCMSIKSLAPSGCNDPLSSWGQQLALFSQFPLQAEQSRSLQCLLVHHMLQYPIHLWTCSNLSMPFSYWGGARARTGHYSNCSIWSAKKEGNNNSLQPPSCVDAAQRAASLHWCRHTSEILMKGHSHRKGCDIQLKLWTGPVSSI